jgi:phospholipase/lecithinase/hemolysin
MKSERLLLIAGLLLASPLHSLGQSTNNPPPFSTIYAFGDCLTDTHNFPPYFNNWNGRYANGPIWIDFLSTNLGLRYTESNNFAVAGSRTLDMLGQVSNLPLPSNASNALFALWGGPIDFYYNILAENQGWGPFVSPTNSVFWDFNVAEGVNNLSNAVALLYAKGGRSFMVPNIDDVSRQPVMISSQTSETLLGLQQRVKQFNAALAEMLASLDRSTG